MTSILEQAIEPLLCLNGAGYFSEEEWIQLDHIIHKKYVWTTGPKSRFHNAMKAGYSASKLVRPEAKASVPSVSENEGIRISESSEGTSSGTSLAPSLDGVGTSNASAEFSWELSPAMNSPAPIPTSTPVKAIIRGKANTPKDLQSNGPTAGYTPQLEETQRLNSSLSKNKIPTVLPLVRQKGIAAWVSAARHGLPPSTCPQPTPIPSGNLVELEDNQAVDSAFEPKEIIVNFHKDVNAFETNNAAEWDEEPVSHEKMSDRDVIKADFEEKIEKRKKLDNILVRESQILKDVVHSSLPHTPPTSPPLEDRSMIRTATVTRSTRRGNPRVSTEPRDPTYIPPLPKTKTCWFWAESVGGCRYRPEECLNLHVKPKPGMLPNYPLKDGKPTWGCLADATPLEVPEGKKPRSCWYWATKGVCGHGTACKYVHGWVAGGVAPRPKNLVVDSSDEEDSDDSDDDDVDLSGRDIGDKAPSQAINMTPGFIASRVHATGWNLTSTT
ncbi:hypothetical protein EV44_g1592 [Erysiphe necator]|uniref:C3H1-type domain-containing protein n=1 Tax=Uncinula necator TaxID=52586 RepID=A0A0B1NYG2_UNCNE|nr:hypothetical protein EV44_g1592 [Erysiphe necator]